MDYPSAELFNIKEVFVFDEAKARGLFYRSTILYDPAVKFQW